MNIQKDINDYIIQKLELRLLLLRYPMVDMDYDHLKSEYIYLLDIIDMLDIDLPAYVLANIEDLIS